MSATASHPEAQGWSTSGVNLVTFFDQEIRPRLTAEVVFTHKAHAFVKDGRKWQGGCPRHDSKSGTSFYLSTDTLLWRCPVCKIGGGPIAYVHLLKGGSGSPRGRDFIDRVRDLCEMVGVPFPERELSPVERERAEKREARRAILEAVSIHTEGALWSALGDAARG